MKLSRRYALLGAVVGLAAPGVLFLYVRLTGHSVDPTRLSAALAFGGVAAFATVGRVVGRRDELLIEQNAELASLTEKLRGLSTVDPLMLIPNRRTFDERLDLEIAQSRRYGAPCALVMIDVDRFKLVNDRHGHLVGDEVLRHVAAILDAQKRSGDPVARFGGDELAAILPHTEAADASAWAERARTLIETQSPRWRDDGIEITASFGVASAPLHARNVSGLVEAADRALYRAKRRGRNTVVVASGPPIVAAMSGPAGRS